MDETQFYRMTAEGRLAGAYLLCGQEELTRREAKERVIALTDPAYRALNVEQMENPTWQQLSDAAARLPFFDSLRVVVVKTFRDEDIAPHADALMGLPAETVVLLERAGEMRKDSAVFAAFSSADRAVVFSALTEDRAVAMLAREAGKAGVEIARPVARRLVEMIGVDANALRNAFQKAAGYVGRGGTIDEGVLDTVVTAIPEYDVFRMLNAFLSGERKKGTALLAGMLQSGQSALGLASFLEGRLRQLHQARVLLDRGVSPREVARALGGSPYAAEKTVAAAKKNTAEGFARGVAAFCSVDADLKTGTLDERAALLLAALGTL